MDNKIFRNHKIEDEFVKSSNERSETAEMVPDN